MTNNKDKKSYSKINFGTQLQLNLNLKNLEVNFNFSNLLIIDRIIIKLFLNC
jgi:hypothetical protein